MPQIKITIAHDRTEETLAQFKKKLKAGLEAVGQEVERAAKENCPVDTGLLHNSITYGLSGKSPKIGSYSANDGSKSGSYGGSLPQSGDNDIAVYIGTNVKYGVYVEFITRYHHPSGKAHFLRDAVQNNTEFLKSVLEAALESM